MYKSYKNLVTTEARLEVFITIHRVVSLDFIKDFSKYFRLYSGTVWLTEPPTPTPTLFRISSCARLADRRDRGRCFSLDTVSIIGGITSSTLSTVSADLLLFDKTVGRA